MHAQKIAFGITLLLLLKWVSGPGVILRFSIYRACSLYIRERGVRNTVIQAVRMCAGFLVIMTSMACATELNPTQAEPSNMSSEPKISNVSSGKTTMSTSEQMNNDKPEPISGFKFNGNTIFADVISHGCTRNDDFKVEHAVNDNQCYLLVTRVKPDLCRRAPMLQTIEVEWQAPAECQSLPIILSNPVLVAPESGLLSKRLK